LRHSAGFRAQGNARRPQGSVAVERLPVRAEDDHPAPFPESLSPIDTKPLPSFANPAVIPN
jgi:hypothetical protein